MALESRSIVINFDSKKRKAQNLLSLIEDIMVAAGVDSCAIAHANIDCGDDNCIEKDFDTSCIYAAYDLYNIDPIFKD